MNLVLAMHKQIISTSSVTRFDLDWDLLWGSVSYILLSLRLKPMALPWLLTGQCSHFTTGDRTACYCFLMCSDIFSIKTINTEWDFQTMPNCDSITNSKIPQHLSFQELPQILFLVLTALRLLPNETYTRERFWLLAYDWNLFCVNFMCSFVPFPCFFGSACYTD